MKFTILKNNLPLIIIEASSLEEASEKVEGSDLIVEEYAESN